MKRETLSLALVAAGCAAIGLVAVAHLGKPKPAEKPITPAGIANQERRRADASYGAPAAKDGYRQFVEKWKSNPDKRVQDEVGAARIRLAYLSTKEKNFAEARQMFIETASEYKGSGAMSPDFGGIKDQALYQAAVRLSAEGKKAEARKALVEFIKTQPQSPLVDAAYKRIVKMDGKATGEVNQLLQIARTEQEKKIRFEMSVCGPKAIAYVFEELGKEPIAYERLAKECGTTDRGTTIDGLKKGLRSHGVEVYGYQVPIRDLNRLSAPAILLVGDHYVVFDHLAGDSLYAYDPMYGSVQKLALQREAVQTSAIPVLSLDLIDLSSN